MAGSFVIADLSDSMAAMSYVVMSVGTRVNRLTDIVTGKIVDCRGLVDLSRGVRRVCVGNVNRGDVVTVVVAVGAGLRVTALVSIVLVAADSLMSVRLAARRSSVVPEPA